MITQADIQEAQDFIDMAQTSQQIDLVKGLFSEAFATPADKRAVWNGLTSEQQAKLKG